MMMNSKKLNKIEDITGINNNNNNNIDTIIIPPPLKTNLPLNNRRINEIQSTKSTPRSPKGNNGNNNRLYNSNTVTNTPNHHLNELISSATPIDYKRKDKKEVLINSSNTPRNRAATVTNSSSNGSNVVNLPPRPNTNSNNVLDRLTRPTVCSNMQKKPKVGLYRTDSMSKLESKSNIIISSNSNDSNGKCNSSSGLGRHSKTSSDIIELPKISSARTERRIMRGNSKLTVQFSGEDDT